MKSLHLTLMIFCHVLLASFILYSTLAEASQVIVPEKEKVQPVVIYSPAESSRPVAAVPIEHPKQVEPAVVAQAPAVEHVVPVVPKVESAVQKSVVVKETQLEARSVAEESPVRASPVKEVQAVPVAVPVVAESKIDAPVQSAPRLRSLIEEAVKQQHVEKKPVSVAAPEPQAKIEPKSAVAEQKVSEKKPVSQEEMKGKSETVQQVPVAQPVREIEPVAASVALVVQSPEPKATVIAKVEYPSPVVVEEKKQAAAPVAVNGGLGPLHLLATTLCSYQPDNNLAGDEILNTLYSQRASVRKSLFDFMSLKFTNLEKLSSRLNSGLEVVPPKSGADLSQPGVAGPSHGWPVVGKCTAHDLKLMAEAAWCETQQPPVAPSSEALDKETPKITSNQHRNQRLLESAPTVSASGSIEPVVGAAGDQSAVISKILHVSDVKDAPSVESSIANLNLTQQQLADIQAQATSTRMCRRNALRLTKALFNHLAEDQRNTSDSWPQLYAQLSDDDCARKRMIDIVNALSGFRTDSTTIRRDNVEFAFAMDDLRTKVLDSEVNVPLTFDKQFIEVEQFLQQSVKLMLANIDPERAKLTSMRYRSLMPGPLSADDQCIELHQRLLAKNYPTDCNPTQFGQLPDVLRMAASSLELWSIEKELSRYSPKIVQHQQEYPASSATSSNVNECIANLVAS